MIAVGPDFRVPPDIDVIQLVFLLLVVDVLQRADAGTPGTYTLTSWYRDPMRNAAVGGVSNSLHLSGLAIDVVVDTPLSVTGVLTGIFGEVLGQRVGSVRAMWQALAPPITQAVLESDHTHLELDLG